MTANQIAYQQLKETQRSNLAKELETKRSNLSQEEIKRNELYEKIRSNLTSEGLRGEELEEQIRSNLAKEGLTQQQIDETIRRNTHSIINEYIGSATKVSDSAAKWVSIFTPKITKSIKLN